MKKPGWESALARYCARHAETRFSYGRNGLDCCRFVWGAIEAQTGADPGARFRSYATRTQALRMMREYAGHPKLEAAIPIVMSEARFDEIQPAAAQRGDVVMIRQGQTGASLGLVALDGRTIVTMGEYGIYRLPRGRAFRAWRIA